MKARLRDLYDFVETKYRALQALIIDERTYSEIVVPMLLERIPDSIRLTITGRVDPQGLAGFSVDGG